MDKKRIGIKIVICKINNVIRYKKEKKIINKTLNNSYKIR